MVFLGVFVFAGIHAYMDGVEISANNYYNNNNNPYFIVILHLYHNPFKEHHIIFRLINMFSITKKSNKIQKKRI